MRKWNWVARLLVIVVAMLTGCSSDKAPTAAEESTLPTIIAAPPDTGLRVESDRICFSSAKEFEVRVNTWRKAQYPEYVGNRFVVRLGVTAVKMPVDVHMEDCNLRFGMVSSGKVINLDGDLSEYGVEKVCGPEWNLTENVKVANDVFPSEIDTNTKVLPVNVLYGVEFPLSEEEAIHTISLLRPQDTWHVIRRGSGDDSKLYAYSEIGPSQLEEGALDSLKLEELTGMVDTAARGARVIDLKITEGSDLVGYVSSVSQGFFWLQDWYDDQSPEEQEQIAHAVGVSLAQLTPFVSDRLLRRYLLDLDWERDIVPVDPLLEGWPHRDPDAVVAHYGMSQNDRTMRLWLGRRGRTFFETVQQEVRNAVGA